MSGEKLEVYCPKKECGEQEVHSDFAARHETTKLRRMTYMGKKEINAASVIAKKILSKDTRPAGTYHYYQCPVCGGRRVYHESGGLTKEVDPDVLG
jgi:predicted RNA-binding Zn-ribbon protein involved in translation (DUF1610 family)